MKNVHVTQQEAVVVMEVGNENVVVEVKAQEINDFFYDQTF